MTGSVLTASLNGYALLIVGVQRGGGLSEALVEVAAALTAGDVDEHAVEHNALLLVLVEAEVEKLAQVSPALRRTEGVACRMSPAQGLPSCAPKTIGDAVPAGIRWDSSLKIRFARDSPLEGAVRTEPVS